MGRCIKVWMFFLSLWTSFICPGDNICKYLSFREVKARIPWPPKKIKEKGKRKSKRHKLVQVECKAAVPVITALGYTEILIYHIPHKFWHPVQWDVPADPLGYSIVIQCQFEIYYEKKATQNPPKTLSGKAVWWQRVRQKGRNKTSLGKSRGHLLMCLGKKEEIGLNCQASCQAPFLCIATIKYLSWYKKSLIPVEIYIYNFFFRLRAVRRISNQYIVKCQKKLGWGGLMNPPFPSSQWAFFMEGKINYLWQIHQSLDELPSLPGGLWRITFFQCGYIGLA